MNVHIYQWKNLSAFICILNLAPSRQIQNESGCICKSAKPDTRDTGFFHVMLFVRVSLYEANYWLNYFSKYQVWPVASPVYKDDSSLEEQ